MLERISRRLANSVLFWDLLLTLLGLYITAHIRLWIPLGKNILADQTFLPGILYLVVAGIWITVFLILTPQRAIFTEGLAEALGRLLASIVLASLCFAGLLYLSPFRDVSRLQFLYFVATNLVLLLTFHLIVRVHFRSQQGSQWQRRVLIIVGGSIGQQIITEFVQRQWTGLRVVGYVSDEPAVVAGVPLLGTIHDTEQIVREHQVDEVIFALPTEQQEQVVRISLTLQHLPVMIHMVPSLLDLAFARTSVGMLGGIPLISLRESTLGESQRLMKRVFDIAISSLALVLLSPVMLIIALWIKLDSPGPVLFLQERIGENGKRFQMMKFRSMYQDAEQRWTEVMQRDSAGNIIHKHSADMRVTWLGHKLRRTSLDELPQLINVLRGEMSLVGPRPEIPRITDEYEAWQWQRFRIPPGMTGWWQVNGRSDKPMHLHTEDDLFYIQNYSFWLDIQILFRTIIVVLRGHGAY